MNPPPSDVDLLGLRTQHPLDLGTILRAKPQGQAQESQEKMLIKEAQSHPKVSHASSVEVRYLHRRLCIN
jgi:hypothetical protein